MLELRNLTFEADGKRIVDDISLTFTQHAFTVITGPNGGGKSTLAKLIMGIERPTSGQILFDGEDIPHFRSTSVPSAASGMPFSSRRASKG